MQNAAAFNIQYVWMTNFVNFLCVCVMCNFCPVYTYSFFFALNLAEQIQTPKLTSTTTWVCTHLIQNSINISKQTVKMNGWNGIHKLQLNDHLHTNFK